MNHMKSERVSCVVEQLRAGGSRDHLLSRVASALSRSSLLHQLFVHLLPASATVAHVLLLREDLAGCARGGETGEHTAWPLTSNVEHLALNKFSPAVSVKAVCVCVCVQVTRIKQSSAEQREGRILLMVVSMVTGYLLCWMPYGVVAMLSSFGRPGAVPPAASLIPSLLAKTSTVLNPVIYLLLNKQVTTFPLQMFFTRSPSF